MEQVQELQTPVNEVETQSEPVQKAKPKPKSDKTIIKELRKEVRELTAKLEETINEVETQEKKAEHYFREATKAKRELEDTKENYGIARNILLNGINATLQVFNMKTKYGGQSYAN